MARSADPLSISEARRLGCVAQGFGSHDRSSTTTQRDVVDVFKQLGVIQIDSVNVLVRSQELPLFSRLGVHDRQAIPTATKKRQIFEYWGHAATQPRICTSICIHCFVGRWTRHDEGSFATGD